MLQRRTPALHSHRWSAAAARYFVTCCTKERQPLFDSAHLCTRLIASAQNSDSRGDTLTLAFVVMPDHVHWLFELGERLTLGRVVARFKATNRAGLTGNPIPWQRDFFERRLRSEESAEAFARYIFLNPHRRGLAPADTPRWWTACPDRLFFLTQLEPDRSPPPAWLKEPPPPGARPPFV